MTLPARHKHLIFNLAFIQTCITALFILSALITTLPAAAQPKLNADSTKKKTDSVVVKLQKARRSLVKINDVSKKADGSKQVRLELAAIKKRLPPIKEDLKVSKKIESRTLDGYNQILKNSQDKLGEWRKSLSRSGADLQQSSKDLTVIGKDSLLKTTGKDSALKQPYISQLAAINAKLQQAGQSVSVRLDTVNKLLTDVSAAYLEIADVQADINDKIKDQNESALKQESPYIWSAPKETSRSKVTSNLTSSYQGQNKLLNEFFASNWDNRTLVILFGLAFFMWIYFNYKKALTPDMQKLVGEINLKHITPVPIIASLIFLLNLPPLFEPDSPALYIDIVQFILLLVLTFYFWKRLPKDELRHWLLVIFLYVVILVTNDAVHNGVIMRLWLMLLNCSSLYIGIVFYRKLRKADVEEKFIKPVLVIYLVLNFLAITANVFGRISLAKIFTVTAIIVITEVIALAIFIQVLTDALELQIKVSSCNGGLFSRINLTKTRASFQKALSVIAVMLWLLVFLINLGIAQHVYDFIYKLISVKRTFGSISFTLGNVIFFSLILYISNIFQKHIGVLFGEKQVSFSNQVEHKSSKLTLIRLVIAIIGVLLAVTASGIPIDKLTVVLGALSVGIGLGMQNIVNNFVSGIIIIFEKPFQIGDFVELADKKGKIQYIGIRASRMLTQQGSEVIIPNGDLVSNRFTNWTVNAAYVRSEILFKVNMAADINLVYKIVQEEINASDDAVKTMQPEILLNSIAADTVELRILVWINSIYVESNFKSHLFSQLIARFNQAQIKVM